MNKEPKFTKGQHVCVRGYVEHVGIQEGVYFYAIETSPNYLVVVDESEIQNDPF